jgi:hypothetical protein
MKKFFTWDFPGRSLQDRVLQQTIKLCSRLLLWSYSKLKEPSWQSYSGAVVPISQMGDDHLLNATLRMKREGVETDIERTTFSFLKKEVVRRKLVVELARRENQNNRNDAFRKRGRAR